MENGKGKTVEAASDSNDRLGVPARTKGEGTMTIAELKELERMTSHMRNVKPEGFHRPGGWSGDTSNLLAALRNLAPELLELWEAANKFGKPEWDFMGRHGYMAGPGFHDALKRLNAKAESMDA